MVPERSLIERVPIGRDIIARLHGDQENNMKVRKLQEQLSKLNPELDVVCYSEDEKLLAKGQGLIVFNIVAIDTKEAERIRLDDSDRSTLSQV